MGAPIIKYSDPRLYGAILTKPFEISYQWIRTSVHPWHPKCLVIVECAVRAIKILTGILLLALTAFPAFLGRLIQLIHYHSKETINRANPTELLVNGLHLPKLERCLCPAATMLYATSEEKAIELVRWGLHLSTLSDSIRGDAIYISADPEISKAYGGDQLVLALDLRDEEVAYVSSDEWELFNFRVPAEATFLDFRELFYENGYKAIKYDLYGGEQKTWAVYDPSCVSIVEVRPLAIPQLEPQFSDSEEFNSSKPTLRRYSRKLDLGH